MLKKKKEREQQNQLTYSTDNSFSLLRGAEVRAVTGRDTRVLAVLHDKTVIYGLEAIIGPKKTAVFSAVVKRVRTVFTS